MLNQTLKPSQFLTYAKQLIEHKMTFMVIGKVGIGKTSISAQAAEEVGCNVIVETPHLKEPTDYHGYPFAISKTQADFLPIGTLHTILTTKERTHVIFDELDKAPIETMNAVAQLILQREVNGRKVPEYVTFSATGNLRSDRAGSNYMPTHLVDRFNCIFRLEPDVNDWSVWALNQGYPLEFVAFNRFKSNYLLEGQNVDLAKDLIKSPTPRTIAAFGDLLKAGLDDFNVLAACAGADYASEYLAFLKLFQEIPDPDSIFLNPKGAPVPTDPSVLYALATTLAKNVTPNSMQAFITYLQRLNKPQEVMAVVLAIKNNPQLTQTKAYIHWAVDNKAVFI